MSFGLFERGQKHLLLSRKDEKEIINKLLWPRFASGWGFALFRG